MSVWIVFVFFSLGHLLILSYRNRANWDNHVEISEKCRTLEKTAKYGCCWWWLSNIVEVVVRRVAVAKRDLKPEFGLNKARITFLGLAHKICHTLQQGSLFPQLFWRVSQIHVSRHADLEFAEERMFQTVDNPTGKERQGGHTNTRCYHMFPVCLWIRFVGCVLSVIQSYHVIQGHTPCHLISDFDVNFWMIWWMVLGCFGCSCCFELVFSNGNLGAIGVFLHFCTVFWVVPATFQDSYRRNLPDSYLFKFFQEARISLVRWPQCHATFGCVRKRGIPPNYHLTLSNII